MADRPAIVLTCDNCGTALEITDSAVVAAAEIATFTAAHESHGWRFAATFEQSTGEPGPGEPSL